jgi:hypothetical protein
MGQNQGSYFGNAVRQFGQGLTFGTSDELEAAIRAAAGGNFDRYREIKNELERQRKGWVNKNPLTSTVAELGGSVVPGLVGAFVPGGQGATVATAGRIARAVDAPLERLLARYGPQALAALQKSRMGRIAVGVGDEAANGALYSVGQAETRQDVPQKIKDDLLQNTLMSLAVRGGTEGIGLYRNRKAR